MLFNAHGAPRKEGHKAPEPTKYLAGDFLKKRPFFSLKCLFCVSILLYLHLHFFPFKGPLMLYSLRSSSKPKGCVYPGKFVDGNCYYAPECKTQEELEKRWGDSVIDRYNRLSCCKIHSALRVAIVEMFTVLDKHGIISFLEAGSALGVVRHNGTQVPWTFDADIGFWIDGEVLKMNTYEKIITSLVKDLPGWEVIVVHNLDENGLGHCAQFQFVEQSKSAHLDLFGYVGGKTDGVQLLGPCFPETRGSKPYILPPKRCKFYDTEVWCPRDPEMFVKAVYGEKALIRGVDHDWDQKMIHGYKGNETYKFHLRDKIIGNEGLSWFKPYKGEIVRVYYGRKYDVKWDNGKVERLIKEANLKYYKKSK